MSLTEAWTDWKEWLVSLSPEFAFLLAIPFAVAAAALLKCWATSRRRPHDARHSQSDGPPARG